MNRSVSIKEGLWCCGYSTFIRFAMQSIPTKDKKGNHIMQLGEFGLNGAIRYTKTDKVRFSEIDVAIIVTRKDNNHAGMDLRRIPKQIKEQIYEDCATHKFKGRGQQLSTLLTIKGTFKLIMALPGETARSMRLKVIDAMTEKLKEMGETEFLHSVLQDTLSTQVEEQSKSKIPCTKYVYATESEAFPGLIKIGRTKDIAKRIQNLNTGAAPKPHKLITMTPTLNSKRDEKLVHDFFADKRVAGEFFQVTAMEVMGFFYSQIAPVFNQELTSYEPETDNEDEADSDDETVSELGKRSFDEIV